MKEVTQTTDCKGREQEGKTESRKESKEERVKKVQNEGKKGCDGQKECERAV